MKSEQEERDQAIAERTLGRVIEEVIAQAIGVDAGCADCNERRAENGDEDDEDAATANDRRLAERRFAKVVANAIVSSVLSWEFVETVADRLYDQLVRRASVLKHPEGDQLYDRLLQKAAILQSTKRDDLDDLVRSTSESPH